MIFSGWSLGELLPWLLHVTLHSVATREAHLSSDIQTWKHDLIVHTVDLSLKVNKHCVAQSLRYSHIIDFQYWHVLV